MKKQLFCLYTMLFIAGALLLPVNVRAADEVALVASVESTGTIAVTNPCATTTATTTTGTTPTATVSAQEIGRCGDMTSPAGVSWNSGGG